MKHFAIALFAVLMVFSLSGCAGDEKASNSNDTESQNVESISGGADNGTAEQQDTSSVDISDASDQVSLLP